MLSGYITGSRSAFDVEDILASPGIDVSHQTPYEREQRSGPSFTDVIRRNRQSPDDK